MEEKRIEKELTGFATIDKPWMKYHNKEYLNISIPNDNYYDYFMKETSEYPSDYVLLNFMNQKMYTREDIQDEIRKHIKMFTNLGVKAGDVVSFMMLNTPEVIFMFLALNKMGAICDLIKFDESAIRINKMLNLTNSKFLFVNEVPFVVENVLKVKDMDNKLEKITIIPVMESIQASVNQELGDFNNKVISYATYKDAYLKATSVVLLNKGSEKTALIVYTGGTTGEAKGVELTNKNLVAMSHGEKYSNYGFTYGKTSMNILPPAIAYYLNATCGLMICGMQVIQIPIFQIPEYPDLVNNFKPNHIFSGPILLQKMAQSPYEFSYLTNPVSGGDKLLVKEEVEINEKLKEKGSRPIQQGYGSTEVAAIATCNPIDNLKVGTLGIPMINVNMGIFEYQTDKEIPYGKGIEGEICISGDTMMKGYINNPEATKKALMYHSDGQVWFHTDDFGIMDEDGYIYHRGRAKRMITRSGNKIWLPTIEEEILKTNLVESCCAVKLEDDDEREVPIVHLVLKDSNNLKETISQIKNYIATYSPMIFMPKYFVIKDELPYTETNKKLDFSLLEKENIFDLDEFNIDGDIITKKEKVKKIN